MATSQIDQGSAFTMATPAVSAAPMLSSDRDPRLRADPSVRAMASDLHRALLAGDTSDAVMRILSRKVSAEETSSDRAVKAPPAIVADASRGAVEPRSAAAASPRLADHAARSLAPPGVARGPRLSVAEAAARWRSDDGSLPLHSALYEPSTRVIARLLELCPQAARETDSEGSLPLHLALSSCSEEGSSLVHSEATSFADAAAVPTLLLDAFPGAACVRDPGTGWLPLMTSLMCRSPPPVVLDVLHAYTGAAGAGDAMDLQPPLAVASHDARGAVVTAAAGGGDSTELQAGTSAATAAGTSAPAVAASAGAGAGADAGAGAGAGTGTTAASVPAPVDDERETSILSRTPASRLPYMDPVTGWLPLHAALFRGFKYPVIKAVLDAHTAAAAVPAHNDELPLHLAVQHCWADSRTIRAVLDVHPAAAAVRASGGATALHSALHHHVDADVALALLRAWPEAAACDAGPATGLPLHVALSCQADETVVLALLKAHPAAASTALRGEQRSLPLHLAARWGAADAVVQELLHLHPRASVASDGKGSTPMSIARSAGKRPMAKAIAQVAHKYS